MISSHHSCSPRPVTTLGVPEAERRTRANCRAHSDEAEIRTRIETIQASSERKDTFGALADHAVLEEHSAEEERPMHAERTITMSHAELKDAITSSVGLIKVAVTAFVTCQSHNGKKTADDRLQSMLQSLANKTLNEKLYSVKFEDHLGQ